MYKKAGRGRNPKVKLVNAGTDGNSLSQLLNKQFVSLSFYSLIFYNHRFSCFLKHLYLCFLSQVLTQPQLTATDMKTARWNNLRQNFRKKILECSDF